MPISPPPVLRMTEALRHQILDLLLRDLIEDPINYETYVLPSEWPAKKSLKTYHTLLLVCTQFNRETIEQFWSFYIPRIVLYFDNVSDLRDFAEKIEAPGVDESLRDLQFVLHSQCQGNPQDRHTSAPQLDNYWFMLMQMRIPDEIRVPWSMFCQSKRRDDFIRDEVETTTEQRNLRKIDIHRPIPPRRKSPLDFTVTEIQGVENTAYVQLRGKLRDIDWDLDIDDRAAAVSAWESLIPPDSVFGAHDTWLRKCLGEPDDG